MKLIWKAVKAKYEINYNLRSCPIIWFLPQELGLF